MKLNAYQRLTSLGLLFGALACSSSSASSASGAASEPTSTPTTGGDATRVVSEADIIQIDSGRLYAMSKAGTLSVVDVSVPGQLTLLGQTTLSGVPFEMYRRGDFLLTMSNGALMTSQSGTTTGSTGGTTTQNDATATIAVLDVHDPARMLTVSSVMIPGEIADSRIVGNVLYLATYENAQCYGCGSAPRTLVTSFDVTSATALRQVDQASFQSNAPDGYNLPWGSNWKRSIFVNDQRLYIGGHADIDPNSYATTTKEGIIDVLDITDPGGRLVRGARINVAGAVLSRWQMDERAGVLRIVSQQGAGRTGNGLAMPQVATFRIDSTQSFVPLGNTTLSLPEQEGLRTVRFDADRAYAITYNQTDPLFAIDLSNPALPRQRGQLSMPGFMFYLEPYGNRVIGLGIDRNDPNGSLNVSLFDVSNLDAPQMIRRVSFASASFSEDYEILNGELPEDQDRIQKAFHVFQDGIVAVPFASAAGCYDTSSGIELVTWQNDTLAPRAMLPMPGNPRRAFENQGQMIGVSDSNVRSFSLATSGAPQTADVVIGTCDASSDSYYYYGNPYQNQNPNYGNDYTDGGDMSGAYYCSVSTVGAHHAGGFVGVLAACGIVFAFRRRQR